MVSGYHGLYINTYVLCLNFNLKLELFTRNIYHMVQERKKEPSTPDTKKYHAIFSLQNERIINKQTLWDL